MARADMKTTYNNMIKYYLGVLNISLIDILSKHFFNQSSRWIISG